MISALKLLFELKKTEVIILARGRILAEGPVSELVPPGRRLEQYFVELVREEAEQRGQVQ